MKARVGRGCGVAFLVLLSLASLAHAHTRSQSFSNWRLQDDGTLTAHVSVLAREATRLVPLESAGLDLDGLLLSHLARTTDVRSDGEACEVRRAPRALAAREGHLRAELQFACPAGRDVEIGIASFFEVAPSHVHFARVRRPGATPIEYLYTDGSRRHQVAVSGEGGPRQQSGGATFLSYVELGVEHILIGLDHVAFLVALLLLCRRVRDVVLMVTGFTVGHSITLTLAALDVVRPNIGVVEALIGFTIAIVAVESVTLTTGRSRRIADVAGVLLGAMALFTWATGQGPPIVVSVGLALFCFCYLRLVATREAALRLAPLLTVVFGLIHGFGFASVLLEIGLPEGRLVPALFGFNVGVEAGQLAIVAVVFFGARWTLPRMAPVGLRWGEDLLAAGLVGLGLYWFVERSYWI